MLTYTIMIVDCGGYGEFGENVISDISSHHLNIHQERLVNGNDFISEATLHSVGSIRRKEEKFKRVLVKYGMRNWYAESIHQGC